jgi:hypothetical protein
MVKKSETTDEEIDESLNELEEKERIMTKNEIGLRDKINKELNRMGYHLRLSLLKYTKTEMMYDYIKPIHDWFEELAKVEPIVIEQIKAAQYNFKE